MSSTLHNNFVKLYAKRLISGHHVTGFEAGSLYRPDIVAIDYDLTVTEYEIKMSEFSLVNELKIIKQVFHDRGDTIGLIEAAVTDQGNKFNSQAHRRKNKYAKHAYYLRGKETPTKANYRPNYFNWVMPVHLWNLHSNALKKLPYGVIIIKEDNRTAHVKKAVLLHEDKVATRDLWELAFSLSKRLSQES